MPNRAKRLSLTQPVKGTPLDRGSSLTRGLVGLVDGRDGFDRISRDSPPWVMAAPSGDGGIFGASGALALDSGRYDTSPRNNWRPQPPLSFMLVWTPTTYIGSTNWRFEIYGVLHIGEHFSSGDYYAQILSDGTQFTWDPGGAWPLNRPQRCLLTWDGTTATVFLNGAEVASGSCTGTITYDSAGFSLIRSIGGTGPVGFASIWNRALTRGEAIRATRNPWELFKRASKVWAAEGGPAPPTIDVQPTEQTAANGATATFTTTVTGATSYQWERLPPSGVGGWANVSGGSGGTTDDYTTPTLSRAGDAGAQYRLKATNAGGTTTSSPALLRVTDIPASYASSVGLVVGSSLSFVGASYVGANDSSGETLAGQTLTNTVSLIAGTFAADSTFAGQTLTSTASLIAGTLAADATIAGQTLTNTVSLAAVGAFTADATLAGQTLTNTVSLIAGAAQADATLAGQTLTNTVSLIPGELSGASVFSGQVLTQTVSLITGAFTADATLAGQTLTNAVSLIDGVMSAGASDTFNGQTLTNTVSLAATGTLSADATLAGQTLTNTVSLAAAGALSADASFGAQLLTQTVSLIAGAMSNDSVFAGQVLTNTVSLVSGTLSGPAPSGVIFTHPLGVDVSIRV